MIVTMMIVLMVLIVMVGMNACDDDVGANLGSPLALGFTHHDEDAQASFETLR